jgi:hypothetical protein
VVQVRAVLVATLLATILIAAGAIAQPHNNQTLDADLGGSATERRTGNTHALTLNLTGDVVVNDPEQGPARTAFSPRPDLEATVIIEGVGEWTIPVRVNGEGVSLIQTGVSSDAWRLRFQGISLPTPGPDGERAQLRGNLTLIGDDNGYLTSGTGVLTMSSRPMATNYALSFQGTAEFS